MSLENIKRMKSEKGFTIVELLIVIVIIGILAAIVIVAYAGITQRANTSKAQANADSVQKLAETINADSGSYPTSITAFTTGTTTSKLPSGITLVRPAGTTLSALQTAAVNTAGTAGTFIPASNYDTLAVSMISGGGGVILYRQGDGTLGSPVYYGSASSGSTFAQIGS